MSHRRTFLGGLLAGAAALLLPAAARARPEPEGDRDGDGDGDDMARSFRLNPETGVWAEIRRRDTKAGDQIILLGLDEKTGELWRAMKTTADRDYDPTGGKNGRPTLWNRPGTYQDFLEFNQKGKPAP